MQEINDIDGGSLVWLWGQAERGGGNLKDAKGATLALRIWDKGDSSVLSTLQSGLAC